MVGLFLESLRARRHDTTTLVFCPAVGLGDFFFSLWITLDRRTAMYAFHRRPKIRNLISEVWQQGPDDDDTAH